MINNPLPLLARQPILNRQQKTIGYELLCRPIPRNTDVWQEEFGDQATGEVLITAFNEIGIDFVTGGLPAFINFTQFWIENPPLFTASKIIAEILENIEPTTKNIQAIKRLHETGFRLALDDYQGDPEKEAFFPYLDIIKVDIRLLPSLDVLSELIEKNKHYELTWLAEKVETREEFDACKAAGCDLFQGYFFSQPTNIYGQRFPDSYHSVLQLLQVLNEENLDIEQVANILKTDPQLSYRALKAVNAAAFAQRREVTSIHQAILLLGINRIKTWSNIFALGKLTHKPEALREQAVIRALICQKLAFSNPSLDAETAFTIGLFSLLPGFLDKSIQQICFSLKLPSIMVDALTKQQGPYGLLLKTIIAMEQGHWDAIQWECLKSHNITPTAVERHYLLALKESRDLLAALIH